MVGQTEKKWTEFHKSTLSFSDELNSVRFYNGLYNINNSSEYNEYCELLKPSSRRNAVKSICIKILNYLKTHDFSNKEKLKYDVCTLLNYWAYDSLNLVLYSNKFNTFNNSNNINLKFAEIVDIWNRFLEEKLRKPEHETCRPISNIVAYNDWKQRKELYEYYVDYSPIYEYLPYSKPDRCKEFYHYVESKKQLYKYFKELCDSQDTDRCPNFYAQSKEYDPDLILSTFKCHQEMLDEKSAAAAKVSQKGGTYPSSATDSEYSDGRKNPFDDPVLSGNSHNVRMYGNVLLGVVATSMTSGALYRVNINSLIQIKCISLLISSIKSS
ncbi:hypothetical protein PVBG_05724 [Plasmodium vivax Brazil I]|uniref:Variable surface protein Vir4 n=1 Tax=Plasmodium vivax (strain Brazil I) TaxID=1033975 RepID=A0A0J9VB57_PLAV1|nr:hypothetical protein PVBG_05724 [Plasmodium vivax Brazil I]